MKFISSVTAGVALIAGLSSSAFADPTVIRIVASNGDRTATQTAISNLLKPGWTFQGTSGSTTSASAASAINFGAWHGYYTDSNNVDQELVIKVSYSGALAGIAAVAGGTTQKFVTGDGTGTAVLPSPLTAPAGQYETGTADFGFSTNFQSTSPFNGNYNSVTYNEVIEEIVGVSPLGFYASPGFPGTNITTQQAQILYTSGSATLAQFTGNYTTDTTKTVWAIGRNTDAGQRFGAYTEVGLGTTTNVIVWQPTITGQTTTSGIKSGGVADSHVKWPAETVSGIFSPLGSGGYSSGALLAEVLTTTLGPDAYKGAYYTGTAPNQVKRFLYPNATAGYYIGYVTPGDGNPRILGTTGAVLPANQGVALKFNGVALTDDNVRNGLYTAWLYNRILKPQSGLDGLKLEFADALRDRIRDVDAPSGGGLYESSLNVERFVDGGLVYPK